MKNLFSFLKQTNWIERIGFAILVSIIVIGLLNSCQKESQSALTQVECKTEKLPGIIGDKGYNPDGSTTYQFNKLDYEGKTYSGGTITCSENSSMKVWKKKQTVFWTENDGASIVAYCYNANGNVLELGSICPDICDGCIDDPNMPGCPHAFVVY